MTDAPKIKIQYYCRNCLFWDGEYCSKRQETRLRGEPACVKFECSEKCRKAETKELRKRLTRLQKKQRGLFE